MDSSNTRRSFSKSDTVIRRYPRTSVVLCNREKEKSQYARQRFLPNHVKTERPKVIGFSSTALHDSLKNLAPLFYPIRGKTKSSHDSLADVFPRFVSMTCNYVELSLVHYIMSSL